MAAARESALATTFAPTALPEELEEAWIQLGDRTGNDIAFTRFDDGAVFLAAQNSDLQTYGPFGRPILAGKSGDMHVAFECMVSSCGAVMRTS